MMIAAIYARKSTEQTGVSEDAKSVARQVAHAKVYAEKKGWTVPEELIFVDDGISGAEFGDRRPGLDRLLAQLKPRPPFRVLVISELSRLGRETFGVPALLKALDCAGVSVHCYLDGKAVSLDTPMDKLMIQVNGFSDEHHRVKTAERVHDTMTLKAHAGQVTGGRCFGYQNVDVLAPTPDAHGRPIRLYVERRIDEAQAEVVRKMFRRYAEGQGFATIARALNDEGAPCPRPNAGHPTGWAPSSVRQVLLRHIYRGEIVWNQTKKRDKWGQRRQRRRDESEWLRTPAEHLRIVSEDLWHAVQHRLRDVRASYLRGTGGLLMGRPLNGIESKYLLTGLAECMLCKPKDDEAGKGGSLTTRSRAHGRHRAHFYTCSTNHRRGGSKCANDLYLPMEATHRAIWESLKRDLFTPEVLLASVEKAIALAHEEEQAASAPQEADVQAQLRSVEEELARLSTAIASGGDLPSLVSALKEREHRRAHLRQQVEARLAARQLGRVDLKGLERDLKAKIADWQKVLASIGGNIRLARQLLRTLLAEKLHFTPDLAAGTCSFVGRSTVGRILQGVTPSQTLVSPTGCFPRGPCSYPILPKHHRKRSVGQNDAFIS